MYYVLLPIISNLGVKFIVWTLLVPHETPVDYSKDFHLSVFPHLVGYILSFPSITARALYEESAAYDDDDFPYEWPIPKLDTILLSIEGSSARFKIQGGDADAEWASLVPGDGHLHLGDRQRPFTLRMFRQLQCLNILRKGILETYRSLSELLTTNRNLPFRHLA
ncbi:uncharacterized protein BT62DRAFT_1009292 [Guyanagaster necrorhizus]|uniref:Uncharacterized protein n=1 Tax=Guyanagaster necrorhizus TaxID=856835 RepID=A0A9P8APL7_9AGAR|nr:uncharacterized protein BT62DRAFT_1009292 [Guyanagaster necrorhizus MCA 3950]KAG7443478.1 hypothetical protein BT62DRAFT_1009292 [Guyanagaster necrorhizus MCA 3950]